MSEKILIVDDDAHVRHSFARTLALLGHEVLTARSGEEALARYEDALSEDAGPDIAIVDVRMPDMDGFEVLKGLRALDPDAEVILMTGHGDMETAIAALHANASDFIPKPVSYEVLETTLRRAQERLLLRHELRATREALRAREEHYRAITESVTAGIVMIDREDVIVFANHAFVQMLGYEQEEILGRKLSLFGFNGDESCCQNLAITSMRKAGGREGSAQQQEMALRRKDGQHLNVLLSCTLLAAPGGHDTRRLAVITDITRRKQAEEALQRAHDELEERVEQRTMELMRANTLLQAEIAERKRAEQALRENETFLRQVIDAVPSQIFVKDQEGRYLLANKSLARFYGTTVESVIGHYDKDFDPSREHVRIYREQDRRALTSGEAQFIAEEPAPDATGKIRWFQVTKVPLFNIAGEADRVMGVGVDITALRQARQELEKREERLQLALAAGNIGIWEYWLESGEIFYSDRWYTMLGYEPGELPMHFDTWVDLLHPEDRTRAIALVEENLVHGTGFELEFRLRRKEGDYSWIYATGRITQRGAAGAAVRAVGTHIDITERKQAELALRASEERFRQVVLSISDPIYMARLGSQDDEAVIQYISPHIEVLTGYPQEKFVRDWYFWDSLISEEDLAHGHAMVARWQAGEDAEAEYRLRRADGRVIWIRDSGRVHTAPDGTITVYGVLSDITARKEVEAALRASRQQYADLVNSIEGIVWEGEVGSFDFTFVSLQSEALLGYPVAQWLEPGFWVAHMHPEDREWAPAFCLEATQARRDHKFDYRMLAADGRTVWLRDFVSVVEEEGETTIRGVMIDITERKRLEERLNAVYQLGRELTLLHEEQEIVERALEVAAQVLDFTSVEYALVDETTNELVCQRRVVVGKPDAEPSRYSLPLEEERGISVAVALSGEAINVPDTRLDPRYVPFEEEVEHRSELCVPMLIGKWVVGVLNVESVEPHAFNDADQQLLQTLADQTAVALENARLYGRTQRDARELAALNSATRAMAADLELDTVLQQIIVEVSAILDAEDASVLLYDEEDHAFYFAAVAAGPSAEALLGQRLPADQGIVGWAFAHRAPVLVDNAQRDTRFYDNIDTLTGMTTRSLLAVPLLIKGDAIGVVEVINKGSGAFTAHDLELLEALCASAAIAIENARLYRDLRAQMLALRETQERLVHSEKMTALGRLVASLAHEINNPLQSIQGCLTLANEEMSYQQRREKLERYLEVAGREIDRIAGVVRRVREFYRPAPRERHPTDIHEALENVLQLTNKQLQHSQVEVQRAWIEQLPPVYANADNLAQVFLNLILNAVDAMPGGGTLTIATAVQDGWVRIAFSDTGLGMSEEIKAQLFEPFFTTKPHGSGLGLSISYGIIQSHNGTIGVESMEGLGTTFTIHLPVMQEDDRVTG